MPLVKKDQAHRLRQLTRALRIAVKQIKGKDALANGARRIARHAIRTHGLREPNDAVRHSRPSVRHHHQAMTALPPQALFSNFFAYDCQRLLLERVRR